MQRVSFQSSIPVFNRSGRKGKEYQSYWINPVRRAFYWSRGVEVWETYQRAICFSRYKMNAQYNSAQLQWPVGGFHPVCLLKESPETGGVNGLNQTNPSVPHF